MSRQSSATATSEASPEIEVDLDQSDAGKAVNRHAVPEVSNDDASEEEQKHSPWLEKSRAVQKRMGRMQRQFDQRLANEQADRQRERREFLDRIERLETNRVGTNTDDAAHEAAVSAIESKIEAALEAGDSKLAARLNREMSTLIATHMQAKTAAHMQQRPREQKAEPATPRRGTTRADKFIEQTEWWDDPEHLAERSFANALFAELTEQGMDPEGDAIFKKINKRLKSKFPDLDVVDLTKSDKDEDETDEEDEPTTRTSRRAPVQNFQDRGQERDRGNKVRLSTNDIAMMRSMRMDPTKDADCLAFVREKQAMAEQER